MPPLKYIRYEQDPNLIQAGKNRKLEMETLIELALENGEGDSTKKVYKGLNFYISEDRIVITKDENPETKKSRTEIDTFITGSIECIRDYNDENKLHNMDDGASFGYHGDGSVSNVDFFIKGVKLSKEQFNKVKQLEKEFGEKSDCLLDVIVMLSDNIAREHNREIIFRG